MFALILAFLAGFFIFTYLLHYYGIDQNGFILSLGVIITVFFIGVIGMAIVDENFGQAVDKNVVIQPFGNGEVYLIKSYSNFKYLYTFIDEEDEWHSIAVNSCVVERIPNGEKAYVKQLRRDLDGRVMKWLFNPHQDYYIIYLPVDAKIASTMDFDFS